MGRLSDLDGQLGYVMVDGWKDLYEARVHSGAFIDDYTSLTDFPVRPPTIQSTQRKDQATPPYVFRIRATIMH